MMSKVLIVDASNHDHRIMISLLMKADYDHVLVSDIDAAKKEVAKLPPGSVVIAAMKFGRGTAIELIDWQKKENYNFPVIALVENMNGLEIAQVMKDGGAVNIIQRQAIDKQLIDLLEMYSRPNGVTLEIAENLFPRQSEAFKKIENSIDLIASSNVNVVIIGESGTGKGQIARQIYLRSRRFQKPCAIIDAGGAALIGEHDPNTFRSEVYNRIKGYFKDADGGTIILKNIHLLSFDKQSVLLHILENEHPDVRMICTSEPELLDMVSSKDFRTNLFFILRQIDISVPPLRKVPEDIIPIANHILSIYASQMGYAVKHFDSSAMKILTDHRFPGNIRELNYVVLFALHHSQGPAITKDDIHFSKSEPDIDSSLKLQNLESERVKIMAAMLQAKGNKSQAARILEIARSTLDYKLKKYDLN